MSYNELNHNQLAQHRHHNDPLSISFLLFFPENNCITFVLLTLTLRPFPSIAFFHLPYLAITSFNDSPHKTRSFAYNNSINEPCLTSLRTSITMMNKSGLETDPLWTPTFLPSDMIFSRTCAYQGVRNSQRALLRPFWDPPFYLITDDILDSHIYTFSSFHSLPKYFVPLV